MAKSWFMFLNDHETFSSLRGCVIVGVDDNDTDTMDALDNDADVSELMERGATVINIEDVCDIM